MREREKLFLIFFNGGLVLLNVGFFYLYLISIKGFIFSFFYFILAVIIPGISIATYFHNAFNKDGETALSVGSLIPMTTIFGISSMLISYLAAKLTDVAWMNYLFMSAYVLLLLKPARKAIIITIRKKIYLNEWNLAIILIATFITNILFFASRPTPGLIPMDIFHDHLWHVSNTVALVREFPLHTNNIELRTVIPYHIMVNIIGAHMSIITGLKAHMVGLQYLFIPLVPLLIINVVNMLKNNFRVRISYLPYCLGIVLFGQGFYNLHEVKVYSLLYSDTNFLGVIFLFASMAIILNINKIENSGGYLAVFLCIFLSTAAKGSIGASIMMGVFMHTILRALRKDVRLSEIIILLSGVCGFVCALGLFFLHASLYKSVAYSNAIIGDYLSYIIPFSYVTKNDLAYPIVSLIYEYLPNVIQIPAHTMVTVLFIPIHIIFYFSYRLIILYDYYHNRLYYKRYEIIIMTILGSILIGYSINSRPQSNAFFMSSGLFMLDILYVDYVHRETLFLRMKETLKKQNILAAIGIGFILILPFVDFDGWMSERKEIKYNFVMYGRVGNLLNEKLIFTKYRKTHQTITPELYDALQFIRANTKRNVVVVTPLISTDDGRDIAYYTSAFSERVAYIEGYEFGELAKYAGNEEISKRKNVVREIYREKKVPKELMKFEYVFLGSKEVEQCLGKRYLIELLYGNDKWAVFNIMDFKDQ